MSWVDSDGLVRSARIDAERALGNPHPYTGSCLDCRSFVKRPLLICFACLEKRSAEVIVCPTCKGKGEVKR